MLEAIFGNTVYQTLAVFTRVGALVMLLPGIGEAYVSSTARLAFALLVALIITPVVWSTVPGPIPETIAALSQALAGEFVVGLFMGVLTRAVLSAMSVAGSAVAFTTGFSNAFLFNPTLSDQGVLQSVFFTLLGVLIIFVTDTHHLFLRALVDSYQVFAPGQLLTANHPQAIGDMANAVLSHTADAFKLGVQIASPFLVLFVIMYTLLAVLARVMPQLQVFFVAMPLQLMLGIFLLFLVIGSVMMVFGRAIQNLAFSLLAT